MAVLSSSACLKPDQPTFSSQSTCFPVTPSINTGPGTGTRGPGSREASYWTKNGLRSNLIAPMSQILSGGACPALATNHTNQNLMATALAMHTEGIKTTLFSDFFDLQSSLRSALQSQACTQSESVSRRFAFDL